MTSKTEMCIRPLLRLGWWPADSAIAVCYALAYYDGRPLTQCHVHSQDTSLGCVNVRLIIMYLIVAIYGMRDLAR